VCGKHQNDYQSYKDHIITEHEEGREYISCPACQAPVRDLKMHFKCKHPKRIMPKNCQMKATVWHDFAPNGKKKKGRKGPKIQTGYFTSNKMRKDIYYRSRFENDFYVCLEHDQDVVSYFAEPFKVPYYFNGKWHNYIPDLRINFADDTTQVWEIKPESQLKLDQNQSKWAAMYNHAENHGWDFIVQTEKGLAKYQMKIRKQKNSS